MESNCEVESLRSTRSHHLTITERFDIDTDEDGGLPAESQGFLAALRDVLHANLLLLLTLLAVLVGLCCGVVLRRVRAGPELIMWVGLPGEMFMRALKMCIIPLIVSNIVVVSANINPKSHGKISLYTIVYAVSTNIIGCLLALLFSILINPGVASSSANSNTNTTSVNTNNLSTSDIFADLIRNMLPANLMEACIYQSVTQYSQKSVPITTVNGTDLNVMVKTLGYSRGSNILGLVIASMIFGLSASRSRDKVKPFINFFEALSVVVLNVLHIVIWTLPVGLASLMTYSIASVNNLETALSSLAIFVLIVSLSVFTQQFVILQLIYFIILRRNPFLYLVGAFKASLTGFATASTLMTLPALFELADKTKIDKRVSRFSIPFATSFNANGSAAFITASCIFISRYSGVEVSVGNYFLIALLSSITVIALPAIPSASIVAVVITLTSMGITSVHVSLLFATEFLLGWLGWRAEPTPSLAQHHPPCSTPFYTNNAPIWPRSASMNTDSHMSSNVTEIGFAPPPTWLATLTWLQWSTNSARRNCLQLSYRLQTNLSQRMMNSPT